MGSARGMRLGVLDVGSNTVHLLVVDGAAGARPEPVRSHKSELRLAELLRSDGALGPGGTDALVRAVQDARRAADEEGVDELREGVLLRRIDWLSGQAPVVEPVAGVDAERRLRRAAPA